MYVIVVGGGKVGAHLAQQLVQEGHTVRLVEIDARKAAALQQRLPAGVVVSGDGSSPGVLEQAGVEQAGVLAAVTGVDETNLVITTLARFEFHVPRTIGRVNNPKNAWLFTSDMGVDVSLNQTEILAKLVVEEMSLGDMMTLLKLRRGEYSLVEEKLTLASPVVGIPLRDLPLPQTCVIAAVIRAGRVLTPRGDMCFETGDEIFAVVHNTALGTLHDLLGG